MREKIRNWLGVLLVTLQAICGIFVSDAKGTAKKVLIGGVVVCAIANLFFTIWQGRAVKTAKVKSQTLISDSFGPLIGVLISECQRSKNLKKAGLANLIKAAEGIAEHDIGSGRRRVSVFEICDGGGLNPRLKPMRGTDVGRNDRSTSTFYKRKGEGKEVWKRLIDEGISQCADIANPKLLPPSWDDSRKREYRSYVSVRIDDADKMYGMLTINSTEAGAFDQGDILELKVLAQILAFGMHMAGTDKQKSYVLNREENAANKGELWVTADGLSNELIDWNHPKKGGLQCQLR